MATQNSVNIPTTVNTLPYGNGTGFSAISAVNNGVLVTSNTGVPSLLANSGTVGFVLAANSAAPASWQSLSSLGAFTSIVTQVITATGTYTPTSGMKYCIVELVGGGGAGGGAVATGAGQCAGGSGGGAGGYSRRVFSAATIGASQSVTIGAGGTGVAGSPGNTGGTSLFGAFMTCAGGNFGSIDGPNAGAGYAGGTGGSASGGDFNVTGNAGAALMIYGAVGNPVCGGSGGGSYFGGGATAFANSDGNAGAGYGAGGSGGANPQSIGTTKTGGAGAAGVCIITEYI